MTTTTWPAASSTDVTEGNRIPGVTPEQVAAVVLQHDVEQFLFAEVRLIDERKFFEWLDLFTDDVRYLVPVRRNRVDGEFSDAYGDAGVAHFDDDKEVLSKRVMRVETGMAWTEDPPSIQRHLVTNAAVRVLDNGELAVHSCFQVHRYRLDREVEVFTGARADVLRREGTSFRIAARTVYLDHATVLANNLNVFF